MKTLAIIAPTFNEEESIGKFVSAVMPVQKLVPDYTLELVISDSHSEDNTAAIVRKLSQTNKHIHYFDSKISGPGRLGRGLTDGLNFAVETLHADILVTMESDLTEDPKQIPDFISKLGEYQLVVGSRYTAGGKIVNWTWWRRTLSLLANFVLGALALNWQVHEYTNLYRCFTKDVWLKIRPAVSVHQGWLFVASFAFEALGQGIKTTEVPITYYDRSGGSSKMHTISYTRNLLRYAIAYRVKKSASFFKFLVVGGLGFLINTIVLILGVHLGMNPSLSGPLGAEFAILSNFLWNNIWTFSDQKISDWKVIPVKFVQFNILSFGSVVIQFLFLKSGEIIFGLAKYKSSIINLPLIRLISWYMVFYIAGVAVGLVWNYIMYSRVIWKKTNDKTPVKKL